jgi:hypothetical protein
VKSEIAKDERVAWSVEGKNRRCEVTKIRSYAQLLNLVTSGIMAKRSMLNAKKKRVSNMKHTYFRETQMMIKTNPKFKYLNPKQYQMFKKRNVQNSLRHLNIWILDLFRISDLEFRIFRGAFK